MPLRHLLPLLLVACALATALPAAPAPAAWVILIGDSHSAYDRLPQLVAAVDGLRAASPGSPGAVLINGDSMEYNNIVARRTAGAVDFAAAAALARRVPVVLNLGNHEPEFFDVAETVARLRAAGLRVISGTARDRASGRPFAEAATDLTLGPARLVIAGLTTDQLSTYRLALRPGLDLADPVVWGRARLPELLRGAPVPVVLSHAGLKADRELLAVVPPGTLFAGAHDHLRFIHRPGATTYVHSGSWLEGFSLARLFPEGNGWRWDVSWVPLPVDAPADPEIASLVQATLARELTAEETAVVGRTARALAPADAARFAVEAARRAAGADVALIGATTFGAGLPAGDVTRFAFDACVRFDGTLFTAELEGSAVLALLRRANQGPDTPFAERSGENLVVTTGGPIEPGRTYRLVTTDWVARNAARYLGNPAPALREQPSLRLKAAVVAALEPPPAPKTAARDPGDDLFELGRQLFEHYAPPAIKADYEFPSRERWETFLGRLAGALEQDSLAGLAGYAPEARATLSALRAAPETEDLAAWLEPRLDEIEASVLAAAAPAIPPSPPPAPIPPPAGPKPALPRKAAALPHYDLWLERVRDRPLPPRARDYLPRLQAAFRAEGLPPELVWLAEAESSFNPLARSPAGARGLFQFQPATAQEFGLSTFLPDDRTDPEKSARAAARYLRQLHGNLGAWPLAFAAYNAGEGRVRRTLAARGATDYAGIAAALPAETRMYVPKVCALIRIRGGVSADQLPPPTPRGSAPGSGRTE